METQKRIRQAGLMVSLALFGATGCRITDPVSIIGIDPKTGEGGQVQVPGAELNKRTVAAFQAAQSAVLPVLSATADSPSQGLKLRTVIVGLGTQMMIGIGNYQVGAYPRFRLIFANSADAILP